MHSSLDTPRRSRGMGRSSEGHSEGGGAVSGSSLAHGLHGHEYVSRTISVRRASCVRYFPQRSCRNASLYDLSEDGAIVRVTNPDREMGELLRFLGYDVIRSTIHHLETKEVQGMNCAECDAALS